MRRVHIDRPFTAGIVTDLPAWKLSPQHSTVAQDLIAPEGIARVRRGWEYDGTTADVADNLVAVHRNKYLLADVTRTLTCDDDGDIFIHNASSAGTAVFSGSVEYLPRCVYRDELLWCAQDGTSPLIRYSGSAGFSAVTPSGATSNYTANRATLTGATYSTAPPAGSFIKTWGGDSDATAGDLRVLTASTTSVTLEGVLAGTGSTTRIRINSPWGYAYPAVSVYNAGTITVSATTATGYGTAWSGVVATTDAFLIMPTSGTPEHADVLSSGSITATSAPVRLQDQATSSSYAVTRRLPFTDAAAHKGSLWGTGVAQFPNNVYVGPPGWNLSFPPGFTEPFDPFESPLYSANANDFLMDSIAVPTAYEGDVNVAILSTPNPLLVLKRNAVYGIYGSYPNFSTDKIADGIGCIDVRSAISGPNGQFWAGEEGVYAYAGGQVIDLTEGKISREWKRIMASFRPASGDYVTIGESDDHLIVSVVYGSSLSNVCFVYDLRAGAWISKFTNHKARYFFSSKVDGEDSELYWVGDNDQGRVMTSSSCFAPAGETFGPDDGDGTAPTFSATTGAILDGTESIDNDARILDVSASAIVYDAGASADDTSLTVAVSGGGALGDEATFNVGIGTITADSEYQTPVRRRFRHVNRPARRAAVAVTGSIGTDLSTTDLAVAEISATVRDRRSRT